MAIKQADNDTYADPSDALRTSHVEVKLTSNDASTLAAIEHDIRTPLQVITLATGLLSSVGDPACDSAAMMISEAVDQILGVFQSATNGGYAPAIELASALCRLRDWWQCISRTERVRFVCDVRATVRIFEFDLLRALDNLIRNAVEAGEDVHVVVEASADEATVCVSVCDDGPGVPEALRQRLFVGGASTKGGSRGNGLAIARALIARAGGSLQVRSSVARGACFDVTLPRA